jgi:hypothetical protein
MSLHLYAVPKLVPPQAQHYQGVPSTMLLLSGQLHEVHGLRFARVYLHLLHEVVYLSQAMFT